MLVQYRALLRESLDLAEEMRAQKHCPDMPNGEHHCRLAAHIAKLREALGVA